LTAGVLPGSGAVAGSALSRRGADRPTAAVSSRSDGAVAARVRRCGAAPTGGAGRPRRGGPCTAHREPPRLAGRPRPARWGQSWLRRHQRRL